MKARIPVKLKRETMAEINRLADREYQKVKDKEIADATRRIFKTIVFALYKDFGFGRDRCAKALKSMTEIIEHSDTDEVFWEHIDRVVIDKLKLEFEKRDYTDNGKLLILKETKKMIDCTKTTNYFSEKKRMGRQASGVCKLRCTDCPMGMRNNGIGVTCSDFESSYPEQAIEVVQRWSNAYPQKTFLTEFLKNYPNAQLRIDGIPKGVCPYALGLINRDDCQKKDHNCGLHVIAEKKEREKQ